ncbi:hypothetical protein B0H14DRAFT_3125075 [Mycena olivaceomarginata]|nr:hypothetical protein B0H14DRAFT_3125075 [Mycena olivaceomarginata]
MAQSTAADTLDVNPDWATMLAQINPTLDLQNPQLQCQLLFSLLVFLGTSIQEFLLFLFESTVPAVRHRAGIFMGNHPHNGFGPTHIYRAWHDRFPKSVPHLHLTLVKPCMDEIALQESDKVISNPRLKVRLKDCTLDHIRSVLNPGILPGIYREDAPYTWDFLSVFTTSLNEYRKKRARKGEKGKLAVPVEADEWEEAASGSSGEKPDFAGDTGGFWRNMGFARNATFTLVFVFSLMAFTRNTGTNLFPMILGLFLEIGGTATAVQQNNMIHATNAAVIALPDADPMAEDLEGKRNQRGKRAAATGADIIPTDDDESKMFSSFVGIVMTLILAYCPGSKEWEKRDIMLETAADRMASDRLLPPKKTDGKPAGVFDVNEGSKKGIIQMLKELQEFSRFTESEWSGKARIIVGDWLTSNNIRGARRDRMDDVNGMERLEYVEELSALWHFALNATHMIMCLHFGNSVLDPGSLAKHKGLLNRTWDAEKPNYADAKALIRHSLISRILYEVMLKKKIKRWADLAKWRPTPSELKNFAEDFVKDFTEARNIERAKNIDDDYYAHSQYFIRDALIFCVFEHGVAFADAGVVLRVLKYWAFSFRGAGLHNYARECIEILLQWKYELTPEMQRAKEHLYLEQNNFWVKRVNIAKGSGVTIKYIIEKGSAPVEVFREVSHQFARTFRFADRARRHKEVDVEQDLRLLTETILDAQLHVLTANRPIYVPLKVNKKGQVATGPRVSSIVDSFVTGAQALHGGKFKDFIRSTAWDPASGYPVETPEVSSEADDPLVNGSAFDHVNQNPLSRDGFNDVDDGDTHQQRYLGLGSLGGGMEY